MLKHVKITLAVFCAAAALTACKSSMKIKHLPYPDAERTEVVDNYFGTEVADPYRWLEDDRSEQTAAWVAAENAVTQNYLDQIPFREAMRARLTELWAYPWEELRLNSGIITILPQRRTTEPGRAVPPGFARRRAGGIPRSQHALRGRNGCAVGHLFLGRWPLPGLCGFGFRFGLERHSCHPYGGQAAHGRYRKMGEALQRSVDTRRKGILLQYVRRSGSGRLFFPEPISEGILSHAR